MSRLRQRPVNPKRRPPLWLRGRYNRSFLEDPRRQCIGKRDLFFDDSIEALAACQALCVKCPVFQDCTRWALANYDALEFGTFAGLSEQVRRRIAEGVEEYYDWRRNWHRTNYIRKLAKRKYRERSKNHD